MIEMNNSSYATSYTSYRNMDSKDIQALATDDMEEIQERCRHGCQATKQQYPVPCAILELEADQE